MPDADAKPFILAFHAMHSTRNKEIGLASATLSVCILSRRRFNMRIVRLYLRPVFVFLETPLS